jgi:hypothetical protein
LAERTRRIAALVPAPRCPLIRFHGVFGPHSSWRSLVVPDASALATQYPKHGCAGECGSTARSQGRSSATTTASSSPAPFRARPDPQRCPRRAVSGVRVRLAAGGGSAARLLATVNVMRAVALGATFARPTVLAAATSGQAVGGPAGGGNEHERSDEGGFLPEFHAGDFLCGPRTARR